MDKPVVICVVGTRPEAIKVAPVIQALRKVDGLHTHVLSTGQHHEILLQALETFGLAPDEDLAIMQHGQTLAQITCRALEGMDKVVDRLKPAMILAQGDTTTTFVGALCAFYRRVKFGHIEAGLRTPTIDNPFPEEFNRRAAGLIADLHFPPTDWARDNLLREGKDPTTIFVTGNTGTDAVLQTALRGTDDWDLPKDKRILILTTHRRENWGDPQKEIARAALDLVNIHPDTYLIVALHPNPTVRATLEPILGGHSRIELIAPPEYSRFVQLIKHAYLILSDSGGVQEEAPPLGVPVLVLRETTERPEGVTAGTAKLVGANYEAIFREGNLLLSDPTARAKMANAVSPYGDGKASERIRYIVCETLGIETASVPMWS